jgi:hypothetical protein
VTASAIDLREFAEAVGDGVPSDLHPAGLTTIHLWLGEMRAAAKRGDAREVARLAWLVRERVALERGWEAENRLTAGGSP